MICKCCGKESHGGIIIDDYSGNDINNQEIINKLRDYLFIQDPIKNENGETRYIGSDSKTLTRYRNGELDTEKEILKSVTVDKNIFNKLKESWV